MNERLLHTPEGIRDIHSEEAMKKNVLQQKIMSVFHRYGFRDVQTPTIEFLEIFNTERGTIDTKLMYKFFDRDGNILALRPDITPSVARFTATFYKHEDAPKRFCYVGNTFRNNESYQLKLKEFTQAGCELIGVDSADADAEIIALTINSLLASGMRDFQIDIGQAGFFKGLVQEAGLDESVEEELRKLIDEKNYIAVEELLDSVAMDEGHKRVFLDLPKLFGDEQVIGKARKITRNSRSLEALDRLDTLYEILKDYELDRHVSFDLGMVSQINYYTGIVFRGYTHGTGMAIVDGGRYDSLLNEFGKNEPAVGFAIVIDEVMNALERQKIDWEIDRSQTLLLYNEASRRNAIRVAENMRMAGMNIEMGQIGAGLEENIAYCRARGIGGIMDFRGEDEVAMVDCGTGAVVETTISELMKKEEVQP